MKRISISAALAAIVAIAISNTASAVDSPVQVLVTPAVTINNPATAATIGVAPANALVGLTGCNNVSTIGAAMEIKFMLAGQPVNVTNFKVTSAGYTLLRNGGPTTWINVGHGSYNPTGDGSRPDFVAYNTAGIKTSTDNLALVGTNVPTVHKFQLTDQVVTLGTTARPVMSSIGNSYRLERSWVLEYNYDSVVYTHNITPAQSTVTVMVSEDLPGFTAGSSVGPFVIGLQVGTDLQNWVIPPGVSVPYPRPTQVSEIIALAPGSMTIPGLTTNTKRFYRFYQQPVSGGSL